METVYADQPGFQAIDPLPLKLMPMPNPQPIPAALMGEKWITACLAAAEFSEADQWQIDFGELFTLNLPEATPVPGIIIYSRRATPLSAWMSGADPVFLSFSQSISQAQLILDAGGETRWNLATVTNGKATADAKNFENTKLTAKGVHFLAIQASAESTNFAGFWLLQTV